MRRKSCPANDDGAAAGTTSCGGPPYFRAAAERHSPQPRQVPGRSGVVFGPHLGSVSPCCACPQVMQRNMVSSLCR